MTTLGALLGGLVLLVVLLGVFAFLQRRPRRGPEQPRTVAELVRMREAARADAEAAAPPEPAEVAEPKPVEVPQTSVAAAEPAPVEAPERADDGVVRAAVPMSREDAAVEAPWARAARMVEPGRVSAEPRAMAGGVPAGPSRRPSLALVPSGDGDVRPRPSRRATAVGAPPAQAPSNGVAAVAAVRPPKSASAVAEAANGGPTVAAERPTTPRVATAVPAAAEARGPAETERAAALHDPERGASSGPAVGGAPAVVTVEAGQPAGPVGPEPEAIPAPAVVERAADGAAVDGGRVAAPDRQEPEAFPAPAAAPSGAAGVAVGSTPPPAVPSEDVAASDAPVEPQAAAAIVPGSAAQSDEVAEARAVAAPAVAAEVEVPRTDAAAPHGEDAPTPRALATTESPVAASVEAGPTPTAQAAPAAADAHQPTPAVGVRGAVARSTNGHAHTPARVAGRVRRRPSATPAEQAAADLALLRTFGVAHRNGADEPEVALEGCAPDDDAPAPGAAQPVSFRVLGRDGRGVHGATVTLLDDHGREAANTRTTAEGRGVLTARHPGGYMLVTAADGYQPGAITVAVTDEPVEAEIPLTRSATLAGTVGGEDGPIVGARLALVQDGEIIDTAVSAADGAYRFADLAAGEYGLSVTAHECEPAAFVVELADEADLRQDVELVPAGLLSDDVINA